MFHIWPVSWEDVEDVGKIWRWAPTLHLKVIRTERLGTPEGEFTMEMERLKQ